MVLKELISSTDILGFTGDMDHQVKGLSCDSRRVNSGDLFLAIKGFQTDGHFYLKDAAQRGAIALVIDDKSIWKDSYFRGFEAGEPQSL